MGPTTLGHVAVHSSPALGTQSHDQEVILVFLLPPQAAWYLPLGKGSLLPLLSTKHHLTEQPCCRDWHWGQWGLPSTANRSGGLMNMQIEAGAGWLPPAMSHPLPNLEAQKSQLREDLPKMTSLLSLSKDLQSPLKILGLNYPASPIALASSWELLTSASKFPSKSAPK